MNDQAPEDQGRRSFFRSAGSAVAVGAAGSVLWSTSACADQTKSQRTSQRLTDRNSPFINVRDAPYGARGNDSTNDTSAIASALDAARTAGGGTVIVPKGTYMVDSNALKLGENVVLAGEGPASRISLRPSQPTGSIVSLYDVSVEKVLVRDIRIDGARGGQTNAIHGIHFDQTGGSGFEFADSMHQLHSVIVSYCTGSGIRLQGDSETAPNPAPQLRGAHVAFCEIRVCDGIGLHLLNASDCFLHSIDIGTTQGHGCVINGGNTRMTNCKVFFAGRLTGAQASDGIRWLGDRGIIVGCEAQDCGGNGFYLNANSLSTSGLLSDSNGVFGTASSAGFVLDNVTNSVIEGVALDRNSSGARTQDYALKYLGTVANNIIQVAYRTPAVGAESGTLGVGNNKIVVGS